MDSILHESADPLLHCELVARTFAAIRPGRLRGSYRCLTFQPGRNCWSAHGGSRDEFMRRIRHADGAICNLCGAHRLAGLFDAIVCDHDDGHICAGLGRTWRVGRPERPGCKFLSHDCEINWSRMGAGSGPRRLHCGTRDRGDVAHDGLDPAAYFSCGNGACALRIDCHTCEQPASRRGQRFPGGTRRGPGMKSKFAWATNLRNYEMASATYE